MVKGGYVRVRNLDQYQHYRDRRPAWVKVHQDILEDYDFGALPDAAKFHALALILLASRTDNVLPADASWMARKIGATTKVDIDLLLSVGWLEPSDGLPEPRADWASRYISDETKLLVLERDGRACCQCGSTEKLEFDHVVPVSKGGTGVAENLQILCRSCNRKKRTTLYASAEQVVPRAPARSPSPSDTSSLTDSLPPLPTSIDTPEMRAAWAERQRERREMGARGKQTPTQVQAQFRKLEKLAAARGVAVAVACVERSTEGHHQGVVFPEDFEESGNGAGERPRAKEKRWSPAQAGLSEEHLAYYRSRSGGDE